MTALDDTRAIVARAAAVVAGEKRAVRHTLAALELGVVQMSGVQPERISWLWPGRIPQGKLTVVEGDPKVGKSTLMLDIAARVTTGTPFPDGYRPEAGVVLVMTAEDGLADTVRPRLDAAGAAVERVIAWESAPVYDAEGNPAGMRPLSIPRDLDALEALIETHCVTLVIIDVLNAYLGGDVDGHKDQDVRRALMPLAKIAERTSCAVVALRHLNKATGGPAIYRGAGSIGIGGAARSILLVGFDPEDEERRRRVLASQGSNVAATPESLAYELVSTEEHGCARVKWTGVSEHNAGNLLAAGNEEESSALNEACEVLRDILTDGPMGAKDVERRAADAGVHQRTLERAKKALKVRSVKIGQGPWAWTLPAEDRQGNVEGSQASTVGNLGGVGGLLSDQELFGSEDRQELEGRQDRQGTGSGDLPTAAAPTADAALPVEQSVSTGESDPAPVDEPSSTPEPQPKYRAFAPQPCSSCGRSTVDVYEGNTCAACCRGNRAAELARAEF